MNEYTTDIRELDNLYLATIAGADYYETRQIVKQSNGVRTVVGLASAWPLIQRDAQIAELTWLVTSIERARAEQDVQMVEQACRLSAYKDELDDAVAAICAYKAHIAALETALLDAAPPPPLPPAAIDAAEHAFAQAAAAEPVVERHACPSCPKTFATAKALSGHRAKVHGAYKQLEQPAAAPELAPLDLPEPPWRCARCGKDTHTRSLERPTLCIKCVVAAVEHTNGHQVAA